MSDATNLTDADELEERIHRLAYDLDEARMLLGRSLLHVAAAEGRAQSLQIDLEQRQHDLDEALADARQLREALAARTDALERAGEDDLVLERDPTQPGRLVLAAAGTFARGTAVRIEGDALILVGDEEAVRAAMATGLALYHPVGVRPVDVRPASAGYPLVEESAHLAELLGVRGGASAAVTRAEHAEAARTEAIAECGRLRMRLETGVAELATVRRALLDATGRLSTSAAELPDLVAELVAGRDESARLARESGVGTAHIRDLHRVEEALTDVAFALGLQPDAEVRPCQLLARIGDLREAAGYAEAARRAP